MRSTIATVSCIGIILSLGICLHLAGCEKEPVGEEIGRVEGYVKYAADSTSIAGAEISAGSPPDTTFITKTDSTGHYIFGGFPGPMVVTAKANGCEPQTVTVEIVAHKTIRLDFFLNAKRGEK